MMKKILSILLAVSLFATPVYGAVSPNKGYPLQTTGTNVGSWGTILNNIFSTIDNNIGGTLAISVAGNSNVNLTSSQASYLIHDLTGVLTGNINYTFPAQGGIYIINNSTTGAFTVTVKVVGGGAGTVVAQGNISLITVDATVPAIYAQSFPPVAASALTGTTLASNVVTSSLTTVGTLINLTVTNPIVGSVTGNAATVTTNANLTGDVTSVGNATTIKSSVALAGSPTTTTQSASDNSTKIATTAYVDSALSGAGPAAASQAQVVAGSSTNTYVSPAKEQYIPGAAKAWVIFVGGSASVNASYNISSVTRNGTGDYTINFSTSFSSSAYGIAGMASDPGVALNSSVMISSGTAPTSSSCRINTRNSNGANIDPSLVSVTFFGTQ